MKLTIAAAALLTETAITGAAVAPYGNKNSDGNHQFTSLFGQVPWKHERRDASTLIPPSSHSKDRRQLEAVVAASLDNKKTKENHVMDIAKTLLQNKKQKAAAASTGSSSSARGQKLQSLIAKGRKHHLVQLIEQEEKIQDCDPYTNVWQNNADVGILSCGLGRYCLESSLVSSPENPMESALGGVCIDMPDENTVDILDSIMSLQEQEQDSRELQANGTSLIDDMYEICYGNMSGPYLNCECQEVNVALYSGSVVCQYEQTCGNLNNVCEGNVTFCYQVSYQLSVSAPYTGGFQLQYDFTSPTVFQYQYGIQYAGTPEPESCTVAFDGTQCNSCEFTQVLYDGDDTPLDCVAFDCGNTELGLSATVCDYSIVELIVADYLLYGSLPCPNGCNLCGEGGFMTLTEQNVTFPNGQIYNCQLVGTAALAGSFANVEPDLCVVLPPVVMDECGCMGGDSLDSDDNVTEAPSAALSSPTAIVSSPTAMPALAPVGISSNPPVGAQEQTNAPLAAAGKSRLALAATVASAVMGWAFLQVMAA
jgi:hypothetical protein